MRIIQCNGEISIFHNLSAETKSKNISAHMMATQLIVLPTQATIVCDTHQQHVNCVVLYTSIDCVGQTTIGCVVCINICYRLCVTQQRLMCCPHIQYVV